MQIKIELWELVGPYWRLPIRVIWVTSELAEVRSGAGVGLTKKQIFVADEFLAGFGNKVGSNYFLERSDLMECARKSGCDDPEDVIEWMPSKQDKELAEPVLAMTDFIQKYCQSQYAVLKEPIMADLVWASFCKWMLHWLVNYRQPIDLEFAKIYPTAARKNWTNSVLRYEISQHKKKPFPKHTYLNPSFGSMITRGLVYYMASGDMASWDEKAAILRWSLEIIPTQKYISLQDKREWSIKHKLRENKAGMARFIWYFRRVRDTMKRQLPMLMESYAYFLKEIQYPTVRFNCWERDSSTGEFKNTWHRQRAHQGRQTCMDIDVVPDPAETESAVPDLVPENASVPKVPDLQPPPEILWEPWQKNGRSSNR